MQSFRTEFENPVIEHDIIELEQKIREFKEGKVSDEKFRSLRLARGVYGQRQQGVQMIRMKLPYGRVSSNQLLKIADVSDEYSTGRLHITTRQDIQIHYVSLDRTPQLWADLESSDVTLREACGNTVRNVTASELAGVDPNEPFDVSPYAEAFFQYLLRNPICQEMGRKFKIAFSSSESDTALTYIHDLGFIPKIQIIDGKEVRGFRVLIGGGLGSQPRHADVVSEFMKADEIIPFTEGVLRVFDRHGERTKRLKARMKFLLNSLGLEGFLGLVKEEIAAVAFKKFAINPKDYEKPFVIADPINPLSKSVESPSYKRWKESNVFSQKQKGYYTIGIKVELGDFYTDKARVLAKLIKEYAGDELRFTIRQNMIIRHVREDLLPFFFLELDKLGFARLGYNSAADITACPGTDTCNLGIASSTGLAKALEDVINDEYPQYLNDSDLAIKISGCMNACGQHNMAHIGFQGMTIKVGQHVIPASQVLIGGGVIANGEGRFAQKILKIPSKRSREALRFILDDFEEKGGDNNFLDYYDEYGERYFYDLLKPLSNTENLTQDEYLDWGYDEPFKKEIGVGECAGVIVDLVATLFLESEEKLDNAKRALENEKWADSIYYSYASYINSAKALLLTENVQTNTQAGIVAQFDEVFKGKSNLIEGVKFSDLVFQINKNEPSKLFAKNYYEEANSFFEKVKEYRNGQLNLKNQ